MNYTDHNATAWDAIADCKSDDGRNKFTQVISHEDFLRAKAGVLHVTLTAAKYVPESWFPPMKGKKVLGLASGGGQQGPVFVAHGAEVTITDISDSQLARETFVAKREGYAITVLKCDMSKPLPFEDNMFDLIFNPVSNCYIEDILPLWSECARVIKPNGILMTGFIKEEQFMFDPDFLSEDTLIAKRRLPYNPLIDLSEEKRREMIANRDPFVFSHTLTEQIGGLIYAGFVLTDIYEDGDGGGLFDKYMQSYVAVRAKKYNKKGVIF